MPMKCFVKLRLVLANMLTKIETILNYLKSKTPPNAREGFCSSVNSRIFILFEQNLTGARPA